MTSASVRRRAILKLGALSTVLVMAGTLPWFTAGPLAARLIALPLLLAGVLMAAVTARLGTGSVPAAVPARVREPNRPAACATCTCGTAGCAADPEGRARGDRTAG